MGPLIQDASVDSATATQRRRDGEYREGGRPRAPRRPRVLFLGSEYAGHRTRFLNLRETVERDGRLDARFRSVTGWHENGWIERLPVVAGGVRGRIRSTLEAAPLARLPRPDATWTSATEVLTPYLWAQLGPLRRPLVLDLDATDAQLESMARHYHGRAPKHGLQLRRARLSEDALFHATTVFTPWSNWAAEGLRREGVAAERIRILPPGVDLERWSVVPRKGSNEGPLRLLFVGADFERKGGDLLLDLMGGPLAGMFEVDIATKQAITGVAGVRFHTLAPNSPELRDLFARADLFVMPTRADCFGIAAIEAMACGLPVIMGDVGGARDIVVEGETGWLIEPTHAALRGALEHALSLRGSLPDIGRRGRARAEELFDAERNHRAIVSLLEDVVRERATRRQAVRLRG